MATKVQLPHYIRGSLSLSAADTFTEDEIDMNLQSGGKQAAVLYGIEFDVSGPISGAGKDMSLQMTCRSKDAISDYSDADMLWLKILSATSGAPVVLQDLAGKFVLPQPIPIIGNLFVAADTTAWTPNILTLNYKVAYTLQTMTAAEITNLLIAFGK